MSPFSTLEQPEWAFALGICKPDFDLPRRAIPALELAARSLLTAIETTLEPLEEQRIDGPMRGVIYLVQHRAWEALRSHRGATGANRIRRECGLLTVCYGNDRAQRLDKGLGRYHYVNGDGCGFVYRGSATRFDQCQCQECRGNQTRRWERLGAELEAKYLAGRMKIPAQSFQIEGRTINRPERWYGPCQRCGRGFYSTRPDPRRCEHCQH